MPAPNQTATAEPKSAFEAVQLELQGEITVPDETPAQSQELAIIEPKVDPQPGDENPQPDSKPATPEGDGATDPADNAPQPEVPKPDDKKTEVPTDPKADDPAVEPKPDGGMQKKPSDEFGELEANAPARTRERFETMKGRYDEIHTQLNESRAVEQRWIQTVQSTGCTPEQFGNVLQHMADMNSGTVEGKLRAYDTMVTAVNVMAKELGKPGFGYDPLDAPENADLKEKVEGAENLDPEIARELAATRAAKRVGDTLGTQKQEHDAMQQRADAALAKVTAYGAEKRANDPLYAAKSVAIRKTVERVIARLPPEEWEEAVREAYDAAVVAAPTASPAPTPEIKTGLRPTSGPGAAPAKEPGSVFEAMQQGMGWSGA